MSEKGPDSMMMELQDMPVTLVIKAPNQRMGDLTVDCMLGWTIQKLKQHLEAVYPSKPKQNEQRLIYSGKLLQDHLTLKEILHQFDAEETDTKHTVHLVCSGGKSNVSAAPKSKEEEKKNQSATVTASTSSFSLADTTTPSTASVSVSDTSANGDGLRFRGQSSNGASNSGANFPGQVPYSQPGSFHYPYYPEQYPQIPAGYQYTPEQYAWMVQQQQQLYAQYMLQYMQYFQGMQGAGQPFPPGGTMPMSFFGMPHTTAGAQVFPQPQMQQPHVQQPDVAQQQAPQPAAAAAGGNNENAPRQNMRMNAQGGMEEDDEEEGDPRDWLHHTYFLMRLLTFLGILFFYSNISRFLMVCAGSFAIYFFQKMRRYLQNAQRERERQQAQAREQQQQQQQQAEENGDPQQNQEHQTPADHQANSNPEEAENQEATGQAATENEANPQVEEGGRVKRMCLFISRTIQIFFTSLVPAPAELLEGN